MNATEGLLHEIGLSEYEAKTLMCLMAHGTSTAEEISRIAKIPLPRVYDTIEKLIKMGFVLSTKTRPKRYKPIEAKMAMEHYMRHKRGDFERGMETMKEVCEKIVKEFSKLIPEKKPPKIEKWGIWSTKSKNNIIAMRHDSERHAEKEILMFSGDASFVRDDLEILKKMAKKGIKMKLLLHKPENEQVRKNMETLSKLGVEIKTGYDGSMRGNIIDDRMVTMVLKWGKQSFTGVPGTDKEFGYETLMINNPVFVNVMKEYFNTVWEGT
jgi:sugar-specific transcriptional regulator TrmB